MNRSEVRFAADDLDPLLRALDAGGWVNLEPEVDDPPPDPPRGWFGDVFSNRGPGMPMATWHPGERSAGIEHPGTAKLDVAMVPRGWRVVQNHPRRGLVVRVPPEVPDAEVLRWLVDLGEELSRVPTMGRWHAVVFAP